MAVKKFWIIASRNKNSINLEGTLIGSETSRLNKMGKNMSIENNRHGWFPTYCLKNLIIFSAIFLFSFDVLISTLAYGQFDKYKSKTQFDNNKPTSANTNPSTGQSNNNEQANKENQFFGRGKANFKNEIPKDGKFVNLNPETAFGPEVITSFDFPNTDILELTKYMQKLTGINLILDKDLKGKISIMAPTAITVGDAWKAYLTALNLNGYTMVKSGAFYKIIQTRDARYTHTKIYTGQYTPNTENYIMKIIPLKNVNSSEITRSFRLFMSRYGRIIDIKQTNTVIVHDTGSNINRLMSLIKFLDVPGHEETLQIIKVENSSAQEIAKLLDTILKGSGSDRFRSSNAPGVKSGGQDISKIIAEPRTNSIIAMANAEGAKQLRELIKKLDVKLVSKGSGRINVYYLNYGDAETLSKTLSTLVSNSSQASKSRFTAKAPGSPLGTDSDPLFSSDVKITADKSNNAIVVMASPTDFLTIKEIISKLDIPRDQVYVEGLIMETQVSRNQEFGISIIGVPGSGATVPIVSAPGGAGDLVNLVTNNITNLTGLFAGAGTGASRELDIGGKKVAVKSVNALIKAIATNGNSNVLATPQILALDNEDAEFEVGRTVPVTVRETAANGTSTNSVKDQKISLTLKLTPQINKVTRRIKLKINQKIDDISGEQSTQGTGVATVTRSAITTVVVRDRDTVAMGGLMRDQTVEKIQKVPLLGDIPVLGWLFKSRQQETQKVNLLFFLTPKILTPYDKTASSTLKDVLNRRAAHLEGVSGKDDPFAVTAKGLYDKADLQSKGPLYDKEDAELYLKQNDSDGVGRPTPDRNDQVAPPQTSNPTNEPNYQEIIKAVRAQKQERPKSDTTEATSTQPDQNAKKEQAPIQKSVSTKSENPFSIQEEQEG